ncbi:phosphatase PAP2 family protein [uncultured Jatrophihabitans sp.]|uniref:phosphatase PAP2 family protein n=1 Tax=uncultured Jatrophihabitans sp. TaxID=1610747 RepID=UPI0035CA11E9
MAAPGVRTATRWWSVYRLPRWLREVVLVGAIYGAYELSRGLQNGAVAVATRNGRDILHWERALDLAPEKLLTHALISVTPLAVAAAYFYSTMHYIITPVVLIWMYRCHAKQYRTARTALAFSTILGLVVFYLVPTAPPRLLRNAGIPDALFDVRHWGWWGGEGSVPRGLGGLTNQFAAMPSLHVGWALWCGFLLARYASRRYVKVLGVLYPLATTFVVLATGNHYLLDAVAGAVVMALGAGLALVAKSALTRFRARRAARPADRPVAASSQADRARTDTNHPGPARLHADRIVDADRSAPGAAWDDSQHAAAARH